MWKCERCGRKNFEDENGCVGCTGGSSLIGNVVACTMFGGKGSEALNALMTALHRAAGGSDNEHIYSFLENTPKTSLIVELYQSLNAIGFEIKKKTYADDTQ